MKILKECALFYQKTNDIFCKMQNVNKENLFRPAFLGQLSQELLQLKEKAELLNGWDISPSLFNFEQYYSEKQVAEYAKNLIMEVNSSLLENEEMLRDNCEVDFVEVILQGKIKFDNLCRLMDKYIKIVSVINLPELKTEDKIYLEYEFEINLENFYDNIKKQQNKKIILFEKRDVFIKAFAAWNSGNMLYERNVEKPEIEVLRLAEQIEAETLAVKPEQIVEEEQSENQIAVKKENEVQAVKDTQKNTKTQSLEEGQIAGKDLETQITAGEEGKAKAEKLAKEKEDTRELAEMSDASEDKVVEFDDRRMEYYRNEFFQMLNGDENGLAEEKVSADAEKTDVIQPKADSISKVEVKHNVLKNNKQKNLQIKEIKYKEKNIKTKSSVKDAVKSSEYQGYSNFLGRWIEILKNQWLPKSTDYEFVSHMCWKLLLDGQFAFAREISFAFQEICPGKCVHPIIINLTGSGLYMPATDLDTYNLFSANQILLEWEQADTFEQMAVALAYIPIAYCARDIKLDEKIINALPEVFKKWIKKIINQKKNITYLDAHVIDSYRMYRIRLRKIKNIIQNVTQKFDDLSNRTTSYQGVSRVLLAAREKDQCIGIIQEMIKELEPEKFAMGTAEQKVQEIYRKGRHYIPKRKNTAKGFDDQLLENIASSAQKKAGYQTEIVGKNKSKMKQIIEEYLEAADEWLELIGTPCDCNFHDLTTSFIFAMTEVYLDERPKISEYAEKCTKEEQECLILRLISVMDYLTGEKEDRPDNYKTNLHHAYSLCCVPSRYLKKDGIEGYRCTYKNPVDHLDFLRQAVVCNSPQSITDCLDMFIEAEAYSGCDILLELLDNEEAKESFDGKIKRYLEKIIRHVMEMKKSLYQISVYSGWLGNDYLSTDSKIIQLEKMLRMEGRKNINLICDLERICEISVENLIGRFCEILRKQVCQGENQNIRENRMEKLNAMLSERQYTTAIEWAVHINISDTDIPSDVFFKTRFFDIYDQKEKKLLTIKNISASLQNAIRNSTSLEYPCFNFNEVPGSIGINWEKLIRIWYMVKENISRMIRKNDKIFFNENLKNIFELLGWNKVEIRELNFYKDGNEEYVRFDMFFSNAHSRDTCPIPLFGSNSGRRIRMLCIYGKAYAPDKLYRLVHNNNEQTPIMILFFGVLSRARRMELYELAQDKQTTFLVTDDVVIATLCEQRQSVLLPWLYKLTVPFSVQQMYTSAMGVVYPEMFYGRESAKKELGITGSVCAVYGGRQLGKTALLKNIEFEEHKPQDDHYVYYIQLPTKKVSEPNLSVTESIANTIQKDILAGNKEYLDISELLDDINSWLEQKSTRRLLLLLDEADQYLLSDGKNEFQITRSINGLMTSTNRRFKVVFAGLHNVYRVISSPNHPLAHHGKPISIGPLLADELQDAINLVRQPFEVMGYRFESLDPIIRILAETNYYPSLIQLFCMRLQAYLHTPQVWKERSKNLPVTIHMGDIDTVLDDFELKKEISHNFMLTLELDQRYKAIALSIAFDAGNAVQEDSSNDIVKGYDLHWIRAEVEKWPNLFKEYQSLDNLRGLCDELVQLGILRNVSSDRYTLRTVNILNMLGTQESILNKLYEVGQEKYDYDKMYNSMLRRKIFNRKGLQGNCYPLTDQQIHSIFDGGGLKLLFGNHALGLDLVEQCLSEMFEAETDQISDIGSSQYKNYKLHICRESFPSLDRMGNRYDVYLVNPECSWNIENIQNYRQRLMNLEEQNRPYLLILCDERKSHLIQFDPVESTDSISNIWLSTWDFEAVQAWLEKQTDMLLIEEDIKKIMLRLCGWPVAMYEFCDILMRQHGRHDVLTDVMEQTVEALVEKNILLSCLLPDEELEPLLYPIIRIFAEYGDDMRYADIQCELEDEEIKADMESVEKVMNWMTDCKLLIRQMKGNGEYIFSIDSLILELWNRGQMKGERKELNG